MATAANLDPELKALGLTPRMIDVLALLLQGCSNKVIANHLGISPNTVTDHVSTILKRLEVSSRSQVPLKVQALRQSLLDWDSARRRGTASRGAQHERLPGLRADQINVDADYDLRAWAEKFGVDKERLQEAVREVGSDSAAVERYLNRKLDA